MEWNNLVATMLNFGAKYIFDNTLSMGRNKMKREQFANEAIHMRSCLD